MRSSGQTQQILLINNPDASAGGIKPSARITARRIDRLFNQSFAVLRLKWSYSLSILWYSIRVSAEVALG